MYNTCKDVSLLNSHHTSWLLIIRWRSGEMTTELIMTIVFVLKRKDKAVNTDYVINKYQILKESELLIDC